jgi:Receptor family ligand binding region/7 transmembrane sweet-taste receptor of 3 GCPR
MHRDSRSNISAVSQDAYGSALQKSFRDETYEIGIATESFAYSSSASVEELVSVMAALKKSQFRHVYAICFEEKLLSILNAAVKADAIGANYLYIFPTVDPLSLEELLRSGHGKRCPVLARCAVIRLHFASYTFEHACETGPDDFKGSPLSKALHGTGFIQMQGGISTTRLRQGTPSTPEFNDNATTSFDRFRLSWRDAVNDQTIIKYIRSKFPASMVDMAGYERAVEFNRDPNGFLNFNYDVVTALGLAMCRAGENKTFFTGDDIYAQFRQLDFDGASGRVRIIPETGTRDYTTMTFVLWNVVIVSDVDSALEYILSVQFEQDKWIGVPGNAFVFADGTTVAPESLPTNSFNFNYIGTTSRSIGYAVAGIVIVVAIVSVVWTMCHVNDHVVDSSQPLFLLLISVGALMMASSVFPLGIDESLVTSMKGLDTACMAVPWLYFIGTSIALGGLLAKTKAVYKVRCFAHTCGLYAFSSTNTLAPVS